MFYVFLSIFCSVTVAVLLKIFNRYSIDSLQAIIFNYPTALILSILFFKPDFRLINNDPSNLIEYLILALLLISLFYFISKSIQTSGVAITVVAERLSLLIPVLAAFLLFNEQLNSIKIAGILCGFIAIILSFPKRSSESKQSIFPSIVFLGLGVIDVLLKRIAQNKDIAFTTALSTVFGFAIVLGIITLTYQLYIRKKSLSLKSIIGGVFLGTFNFGSILFYLKALHEVSAKPSIVFTTVGVGIITIGSLIGYFVFNENLSLKNKLGVLVAIFSILIFSFA